MYESLHTQKSSPLWKTMRLNLEMTCIHSHSVVISSADLKHIWVGLVWFVGGHRCISAQEE